MPSNRLCVFGCVTTGVTIHKFPNPEKFPERFKMWVDVAGDILKGISDEQIFKLKKVCDKHFMDDQKNRNNRLNALAVPVKDIYKPSATGANVNSELNINLETDLPSSSKQITGFSPTAVWEHPGPCMIPQSDLPFSQQIRGPSPTAELKNPSLCMISQPDLPCSSQQNRGPSPTAELKNPSLGMISQPDLPCSSQQNRGPSPTAALKHPSPFMTSQLDLPCSSQRNRGPSPTAALKHPSPCMTSQPDLPCSSQQNRGTSPTAALEHPGPWMILQSDPPTPSTLHPVTGTKKNLPHLNDLYHKATQKQIRSLRIEICRLRRRNKDLKTKLADAKKISLKKSFENITKSMSLPAKVFTGMQFRESLKKARGRRFTGEEKILSMALYNSSPQSYALLSKCFTLPSTKSLKNLLGKKDPNVKLIAK